MYNFKKLIKNIFIYLYGYQIINKILLKIIIILEPCNSLIYIIHI